MGLRWLKAILLFWCVAVKCDDYTLIEVKSKNDQSNSITICAAFNGEVKFKSVLTKNIFELRIMVFEICQPSLRVLIIPI